MKYIYTPRGVCSMQMIFEIDGGIVKDLKIVGFDDVNIAMLTTPTITTIHQPIKEMALEAIQALIKCSEQKHSIVPLKVQLPVSLVKRETT